MPQARRHATAAVQPQAWDSPVGSGAGSGLRDLHRGGKASGSLLRVGKPAIHLDLENPAAALAQADRGRWILLQDLIPCRTGTRLIASHAAVFDLDLHGRKRLFMRGQREKLGRRPRDLQERRSIRNVS